MSKQPISRGRTSRHRPGRYRAQQPPARQARAKREYETVKADPLEPISGRVAGIDIGSREHFVAAPTGADEVTVRTFGCFTCELEEMADWLIECRVDWVVMESTGVYWVPVYEVLEDRGLRVSLVDAHDSNNLPGRKKTDAHDCTWLRKLQSYGMLRGCFIPAPEVKAMRTYWRLRARLVEDASRQLLLMQKSLEQMNLQLHKAISDISGTTGMSIIRAILAGERDPQVLARMRQPGVKRSEEEIAKALTGHFRQEHLFELRQAVQGYDFIQEQILECERQIRSCLRNFPPKDSANSSNNAHANHNTPADVEKCANKLIQRVETAQPGKKPRARRKGQPHFNLREEQIRITGVDLTRIDGIDVLTAQTIITECGPELAAFQTEKQFTSWLGLSPNNRITGGKRKSGATNKGNNRAAQALRMAAQTLHRSKSALGAFYRRLRIRRQAPVAITAAARKLACLVYRMIKHGQDYVDRGEQWYQQNYDQQLQRNLIKQASTLGCVLINKQTGEVLS